MHDSQTANDSKELQSVEASLGRLSSNDEARTFVDFAPAAWAILSSAMDAVISIDQQHRIIVFNRAAEAIFGCSAAEALGTSIERFIPMELRAAHAAHLQQFSETGFTNRSMRSPGQLMAVRSGGELFPIEATISQAEIGGVKIYTVILRDVTERRRAEEALRNSEERLRLLSDNLPNSMVFQYTHQPDGPRFLYVSAGVERISGVKAEDVLRDAGTLHRQISPGELAALLEMERSSARELSVLDHDLHMRLPDGQLRWMHVRSRPRRMPDGRVVWDGVLTDITDHKQAEESFLKTEKLATVGRIAATIAHEINNPLEAVTNALFLAKESEGLPDFAHDCLEMADSELKRVAHIARQALGFYRESTAPGPTSVTAVLDSALDLLRGKVRVRHAEINKQWQSDFRITAVEGELRQVFANCLANSLDAISDYGRITVRVSGRAHFRDGRGGVRITVADNGAGITHKDQQQMFEPFFTTKESVGAGLGLWVSKQIIEKHGGIIKVRSRTYGRCRGTVVSVVLPFEARMAARLAG